MNEHFGVTPVTCVLASPPGESMLNHSPRIVDLRSKVHRLESLKVRSVNSGAVSVISWRQTFYLGLIVIQSSQELCHSPEGPTLPQVLLLPRAKTSSTCH